MQSYKETVKKCEPPEWYIESVHDALVTVLTDQNKLVACKLLLDIGRMNDPDQRMSLREAKILCDVVATDEDAVYPEDLTHLVVSDIVDNFRGGDGGTYDILTHLLSHVPENVLFKHLQDQNEYWKNIKTK